MKNLIHLKNGFNLVRTQAAFAKLLKQFCTSHGIDKSDLSDYPKSYPSIVVITLGYKGYHYPVVKQIHLNDILKCKGESNV